MERVKGIGGIFLKCDNPQKLYKWYEEHLGLKQESDDQGVLFHWRDAQERRKTGVTVWSLFPRSSQYFDPSPSSVMINYIVEDLAGLLATLKAEDVKVDPRTESYDYGKFGWIMDPEGNWIELW